MDFNKYIFAVLIMSASTLISIGSASAGTDPPVVCPTGARAEKAYCRFFFRYNKTNGDTSPQISSALKMQSGDSTRSIALIAGISEYPHSSSPMLHPAKVDIDNLQIFAEHQGFDEIIVLREADVSIDNLQYFLQSYIPSVTKSHNKARVLFAYSGHGVPLNSPNTKGFLVLRDATDPNDTANLLSLRILEGLLSELAPRTYQFLALINSCYGGDMFGIVQAGENIWDTAKPGGSAITAGTPDELVYSLGGANDGSLFFDTLIHGVENGDAASRFRVADASGKQVEQKREVVRLGDMWKYLFDTISDLELNSGHEYSKPWEGSVFAPPLTSQGGFFLVSGQVKPPNFAVTVQAPSGPVSSLPGQPDIKIFNQPEEYSIKGVDLSQYNGFVDWTRLRGSHLELGKLIGFAYIRATMGADREDRRFAENWAGAESVAVPRGAYHVFDLCQPVDEQLKNLLSKVARDTEALPLAVDFEYYPSGEGAWIKRQSTCFKTLGLTAVQKSLREFADSIHENYGKSPILFGNKAVISDILQDQFNDLPIWFHDYNTNTETDFPGANPWTLWQYTDQLKVAGIEGSVDANAFFGTAENFRDFSSGGGNVARDSVLRR